MIRSRLSALEAKTIQRRVTPQLLIHFSEAELVEWAFLEEGRPPAPYELAERLECYHAVSALLFHEEGEEPNPEKALYHETEANRFKQLIQNLEPLESRETIRAKKEYSKHLGELLSSYQKGNDSEMML